MPSNFNIKIFSLEARRRVNDQDYDFIKPNLSVGQVLLFDENIPVQVTGVTDIGGLNIRIRNLVEGWTCWPIAGSLFSQSIFFKIGSVINRFQMNETYSKVFWYNMNQ